MEPVGVIEILRQVFSYGDATNTHLDIVSYLDKIKIKESAYSKWGRNAPQLSVEVDAGKCVCWYKGCTCTFKTKDGGCNC